MSLSYAQCFLCREWSWSVSRCFDRVHLCLPCYVDVLEVRQARGVMGEGNTLPDSTGRGRDGRAPLSSGNSPSSPDQMELFE